MTNDNSNVGSSPSPTLDPADLTTDEWTLDGTDVSLTMDPPLPGDQSPSTSETTESAAATVAPVQMPIRKAKAKGKNANTLYFDLETIPDAARMHLFGLPEVSLPEIEPVKPRAELAACPKPDEALAKPIAEFKKLVADIRPPDEWWNSVCEAEDRRQKRKGIYELVDEWLGEGERLTELANARTAKLAELHEDRRKLLSTTPLYCSICAFAYAVGDEESQSLVVGVDGVTEADLLDAFWQLAANCKPLCGFNVIGFDLPVIFVRSMILGVPPSRSIDLTPWKGDVLDVYLALFGGRGNTSKDRPGKMKDVARLLGIPVPAGDCDGSKVQELFESDPEKVGVYCESDVDVARGIHRKMVGLFC